MTERSNAAAIGIPFGCMALVVGRNAVGKIGHERGRGSQVLGNGLELFARSSALQPLRSDRTIEAMIDVIMD